MADARRGLPLLSGPPPPNDSTHAEIACRKCNKEFNIIFTRARKCNHCGYSYCHNCSDFQALMPRGGMDTGYDAMNVCAFCIEFLTITAAGRSYLKSLPLAKLKKYVNAYNIKINSAVEKDDIIDAIVNARSKGPNGCLPPTNENYYRKYSVPNRSAGIRPRGLFSRTDQSSSAPPPPATPPRPTPSTYNFPRPDLAPDHPPSQHHTPPSGPPPQSWYQPPPQPPPRPQYQAPPQPPPHSYATYNPPPVPPRPQQHQPPPSPHYHPPPQPPQGYGYAPHGYNPHHNPFQAGPPPVPNDLRPQQSQQGPYQRPSAARSSNNVPQTHQPTPPPRPRTASAAAPTPPPAPPSLDQLITMSPDAISALSIGALKSTLFTNHVNAGMILEKGDLVKKVLSLVDDEKRERERQRAAEEEERLEMEDRQREQREQREREMEEKERRERTAADRAAAAAEATAEGTSAAEDATAGASPIREGETDGAASASSEDASSASSAKPGPPPPLPPKAQAMASRLERTGLCVICQDEEANIAIVDCGHLAMCRACSELIMSSTRECPLCRTRIVTEGRLLRIFKT